MKSTVPFATRILTWFDEHGRTDLPWQQNKTPYRVWISEIMLQQTQVKTVLPYYQRFMQRFPTVQSLAEALSDEVLQHWAGLGYYSRARNLHLTAKKIVNDFAGHFPENLAALQSLPGIGRTTAGAILSIAYHLPTPILDGNVKRVLARFQGLAASLADKNIEQQLWDYATQYTPQKRVADYTQAMMDLGATVCTRSKPYCEICPLQNDCYAFKNNLTQFIPHKKTAKPLPVKATTFVIVKAGEYILLEKRAARGIWGGLWCFPELTGPWDEKALHTYSISHLKIPQPIYRKLQPFRHTFTHYHLDISPIIIEATKKHSIRDNDEIAWINLQQPLTIGVPQPVSKIFKLFKTCVFSFVQ